MATTEELIRQLRHYRYRDIIRQHTVDSLSDASLTDILTGATTWDQAWRRVAAFEKRGRTLQPGPVQKIPKLTTAEYRSRLAPDPTQPGEKLKCWELVIEAFGITGKRTGRGAYEDAINRHLADAGFVLERIKELAPPGVTPTVATVAAGKMTGDWILYTRTHVLAIRDGVIHDRDRGATVKKVVTSAYRVVPKPKPPAKCGCLEAATFGHAYDCETGLGRFRQTEW
jgi:hypothetical protein